MQDLSEVFRRFSPLVFSVSLSVLKSREEAEDLVQEIFTKKVPKFLNENKSMKEIGPWLSVVAKNQAIDVYRRKKKSQSFDEGNMDSKDNSKRPDEEFDLKQAMVKLTPKYSEVLNLKFLLGFTWDEVAKKLRISIPGARKRGDKAISMLKKELDG